ncbi:hypothetical protein [Actinacidiphila oryziradicis]|uniref:hypothetical protein n=1 Tax=Actinacidiphila oryziradicis TaxID=2571141 RepID=UPI0023F40467|nr:hypothetical protein [Actinacidiphila oryziradicis]MCW2871787.1 hypothetical protein [Actinacidiphila oryziradicis]
MTAHTGDGSVRLEFAEVPDRVVAHTSDGGVLVELPKERYRVSAQTGTAMCR